MASYPPLNGGIADDLVHVYADGSRAIQVRSATDFAAGGLEVGRVMALSRADVTIVNANYYSAYVERTGVPAGNTYYYEMTAPPTTDIAIDSILPTLSFANSGTGTLLYQITVFLADSDLSTYTYTGGSAAVNLGRNMNGGQINKLSGLTVSAGGAATITGSPDFLIGFTNYQLESQGASRSVTSSEARFFESGRAILIPAGKKLLVRVTSSGTITGTFDVQTFVTYAVLPI